MAAASFSSPLRRLSRIFSASPRNAKVPKPKPKTQDAANPNPFPASANGPREAARRILRRRDPEKLVSEFISASAASRRFRSLPGVFEDAVSRLAAAGRRDCVAALLDAQKPLLPTSRKGFSVHLVSLYGLAAMPSEAAAAFRDLPPAHRSTPAFNALLTAYAGSDQFEALVATFEEIPRSDPSIIPDIYSYNILINAFCQKADLSAALDVIPRMEKSGIPPDAVSFNTLLNAFYNNGRLDEAEKVWELIKEKNVAPVANMYNAKIRGLIAKWRIEDAAEVVRRMETEGPKPNTVSYNELMRAYCKDGMLEEAKKVYEDMQKNDYTPNKGTFETLVPCLLRAGELDLALRYCHESINRNCRVDCSLVQNVVAALVKVSRIKEATALVALGMENHYPHKPLKILLKSSEKLTRADQN